MSDAELLAAALFGLEHRHSTIEEQIAEVRRMVRKTDLSGSATPPRKKRTLSAAARRQIAAGTAETMGQVQGEEGCGEKSDTPRRAGGLMGWAASKAVGGSI